MKRMLFILLALLTVSVAEAQLQQMETVRQYITATSWTRIQKADYSKIIEFEVANDAAYSKTDTLWVCFNADTTALRKFPLLSGEIIHFGSVYLSSIRLKASADSIFVRVRYH